MESIFNTALSQLGIAAALVVGLIVIARIIWGEYKEERKRRDDTVAARFEDAAKYQEAFKALIQQYATLASAHQQSLQNIERLVEKLTQARDK